MFINPFQVDKPLDGLSLPHPALASRKSSLTESIKSNGGGTSSGIGAGPGKGSLVSDGGVAFTLPFFNALGSGDGSRSRQNSWAAASSTAGGSRPGSARGVPTSRAASFDSLNAPPGLRRGSSSAPTPLSPIAVPLSPCATTNTTVTAAVAPVRYSAPPVDFSRRRSVDVGVLGLGYHRHGTGGNFSRSVRDAIGPDAEDKADGLIGSGPKGKDRMLGRHLASILAHSVALCSPPTSLDHGLISLPPMLPAIPGSPLCSPSSSRQPSMSDASSRLASFSSVAPTPPPAGPLPTALPLSFPVFSLARRHKLISQLQSWSFDAMSYTADDLLGCVGLMFESLRNMHGVDFDLEQFRSLLISLRSAYHSRNGYHNFSHATDVTHACYSFLVRMGLAPPLFLLCEDDYDINLGQGRRKWKRNRAVEEGGMGELLRPMDVFALMVAAIGHDVGHPGLSNAYMVNARTPLAQVYEDKSVLENFHTVTLIHMLRRHNFGYLLGDGFGRLGDDATSFRKVLERSILSTDMSRHFTFVSEIKDMGRRLGDKKVTIEADRLLLCSGLIKCADISNPTRPHRISRLWSTALLEEWSAQAVVETEFGLPISVMCVEITDTKAQAKSQVGFIDLFAEPLFNVMAGVVEEFADFAEKLRDGRKAWEAISLQTDEAYQSSEPAPAGFRLSQPPVGRVPSSGSLPPPGDSTSRISPPAIPISTTPSHAQPHQQQSSRAGGVPASFSFNRAASTPTSSAGSPLSPFFHGPGSLSSITTGASSTSQRPIGHSSGFSAFSSLPVAIPVPLSAPFDSRTFAFAATSPKPFQVSCDGACHTATAQCEGCVAQETRRGSLGRGLAGIRRRQEEDEEKALRGEGGAVEIQGEGEWPPFPFRPAFYD